MESKPKKEKKPTVTELKLSAAYDWLESSELDVQEMTYPGQAEVCYRLQQTNRLTRAQIADVTGLTSRQVQTRLKQYRRFVASGDIPSQDFKRAGIESHTGQFPAIIEDELERREGAKATKEAKTLIDLEVLLGKVIERIGPLLPVKPELKRLDQLYKQYKPVTLKGKKEEIAVAVMSDLHLFLKTHDHDYDKAIGALDTFVKKILHLTELHRTQCNVNTIHLLSIGDLIQGTANYPSQRWDVDRPAVDQAEGLTVVLVRVIEILLMHFESVVIDWAEGNHEYIVSKKTNPDPAHSSWGRVVIRALIWAFRENKRVKFNVPETWYQVVDIAGAKFMLTHGHAVSGSGTFDGIVATARKWADVVPAHDYLVMGHFHRLAKLPLPRAYGSSLQRTLYLNGTAVDSDDFIQQMGGSPTPQWWFMFVKEGRGVTAEYAVDLYGD